MHACDLYEAQKLGWKPGVSTGLCFLSREVSPLSSLVHYQSCDPRLSTLIPVSLILMQLHGNTTNLSWTAQIPCADVLQL